MTFSHKIPDLTAVILTGGHSKRMGKDKGLLKIADQRFVDIALHTAGSVCEQVMVVCGRHNLETFNGLPVTVVADERQNEGPIMGLITAMKQIRTGWVVVLSVDTPFFDASMIRALWQQRQHHEGVVFTRSGRIHPLNALYQTATLHHWQTGFEKGERKLQNVLKIMNINYLEIDENAEKYFRNINTPKEYEQITI